MSREMFVKFECAYCDEVFVLSKKQVDEAERIAVIKCPNCNDTENIVEVSITDKSS